MRWSMVVVVAVVLAGCSQEIEPAQDDTSKDYEEFELEETKDELGVIRGVVVDAAVRPLANAVVSIGSQANVTTKESGAFAFKDLGPGAYFIKVTRAGYRETQTSTEVVAGVKEPPALRVMLERVPGTEPGIVPLVFDGHIMCSLRQTAGFSTGCLISLAVEDFAGDRREFDVASGNVHWMQTELTWKPTQETGKRLCLRVYGYGTDDVCGEDPVIQAIGRDAAKSNDLGAGGAIEVVVYVDFFVEPAFGLAIDQDFQAFTHAFYNFAPPDGWQFGRDDLPPTPA